MPSRSLIDAFDGASERHAAAVAELVPRGTLADRAWAWVHPSRPPSRASQPSWLPHARQPPTTTCLLPRLDAQSLVASPAHTSRRRDPAVLR